jgi:hypothetical protein
MKQIQILVGEIVRQARSAWASEVLFSDHTLNDWKSSYKNSGNNKLFKKLVVKYFVQTTKIFTKHFNDLKQKNFAV